MRRIAAQSMRTLSTAWALWVCSVAQVIEHMLNRDRADDDVKHCAMYPHIDATDGATTIAILISEPAPRPTAIAAGWPAFDSGDQRRLARISPLNASLITNDHSGAHSFAQSMSTSSGGGSATGSQYFLCPSKMPVGFQSGMSAVDVVMNIELSDARPMSPW